MAKKTNKSTEILQLSDEILLDIEVREVPLEKIISKCKKLARMTNDFQALKWFILELHGYDRTTLPEDITEDDLTKSSNLAGRTIKKYNPATKENECHYWTSSIPELESIIETNKLKLSNLKTPEQFTPAITQGVSFGTTSAASWVQESFRDVLTAIKSQQDVISQEINQKKSLLSKITNNIYNYVLNLNLQFKFEDITESAFQKIKNNVDKILQKQCPNTIKQFLAAYKRLESDNFEEWSQAMSSCRNILKEFANSVFPAQPQNYKKSDGEEIEVTDDKYKNRIIAFIDKTPAGRRTKQFTENRVHALNNILSDGAKNEIKKQDANICVLETYLVIASLIRLMTN